MSWLSRWRNRPAPKPSARIEMTKVLGSSFGAEVGGQGLGILGPTAPFRTVREERELLKAYGETPDLYVAANKLARTMASAKWGVFRVSPAPRLMAQIGRDADGHFGMFEKRMAARELARSLRALEPDSRAGFLMRQTMPGEDRTLVPVPDHPAIRALEAPNAWMEGCKVRLLIGLYLYLTGSVLLAIDRNAQGEPSTITPFAPSMLQKQTTRQSTDPFVFMRPGGGTFRPYPSSDVIIIRDPDPANPFSLAGVGPARSVSTEIAIYEESSRTSLARFRNSGFSRKLINVQGLSKEGLASLNAQIVHGGGASQNINTLEFINTRSKVDTVDLDAPLTELGVQDVQEAAGEMIRSSSGIPPEILGRNKNSNRATSLTARGHYHREVIDPRLSELEEALNTSYLPMFDDSDGLVMAYQSMIPEDKDHVLEVMNSRPTAFSNNEYRARAGIGVSTRPVDDQYSNQLSGQQVQSAMAIVQLYYDGSIPRESARVALRAFFKVDDSEANEMLAGSPRPRPTGQPNMRPGAPGPDGNDQPEDDDQDENSEERRRRRRLGAQRFEAADRPDVLHEVQSEVANG